MMNFLLATLFLGFVTVASVVDGQERGSAPSLRSYGPFSTNYSSVSGFSSGGAMTFQFMLSHSSQLIGAGVFSGLMYECGYGSGIELTRLARCIRAHFDYDRVVKKIEYNARKGLFDPTSNLRSKRYFVHHGTADPLIVPDEGDRITRFFTSYSPDSTFFNKTGSGHVYPTEKCGSGCTFFPSVSGCGMCGWQGSYESLNYIYGGNLQKPTSPVLTQCNPDDADVKGLYSFNQAAFFPKGTFLFINMDDTGYIYVPPQCEEDASKCTLHVHFHGCGQEAGSPFVGTQYIKCSGVMGVAEANNIIVLFPQASIGLLSISNILQCWDFVGYTGPYYGTKKGPQIKAVKGMVDRILANRSS